jgi:hypothetical protein
MSVLLLLHPALKREISEFSKYCSRPSRRFAVRRTSQRSYSREIEL